MSTSVARRGVSLVGESPGKPGILDALGEREREALSVLAPCRRAIHAWVPHAIRRRIQIERPARTEIPAEANVDGSGTGVGLDAT